MASLTLVVMAAGLGSRYGGLKQIDPVGPSGEVVLDYSVYDALRAGFDRVVFIIREDIETAFRERIGRRIEGAADTAYVLQSLDRLPPGFAAPAGRTKPWGTAQAILACRDAVTTPFLAVNADDYYGRSAFEAMAGYLGRGPGGPDPGYAMVGYRLENTLSEHGTVARGVCEATADLELVGIRELLKIRRFPDGVKHTLNGSDWQPLDAASWTSMNFWGFTPALFAELERLFPEFLRRNEADILKAEFLIPEVVGRLIREKRARVRVLPTRERWFGMTYPEDRPLFKAAILELVEAGAYPRDLWSGRPASRVPGGTKTR
ncbi:MAG TPA: nucleotidyltransferase [Candidatus Aminicenantes bacterium]|nr:nucleotidyltransferase [Candidatus Aminicenantes bacterium]HRY65009.1 nucleotidyltransferase [Candidatus Aminicenantes bacterium]HRZ71922.1 nucleotidyltransferase [Candidatus Aminicenantes bacterium]